MNYEQKKTFIVNILYLLIITILTLLVCKFLLSYLLPFVIGVAVTVLAQKPAVLISEKLKIKREICSVILVIGAFLIIVAAAVLSAWLVVSYAGKLSDNADKASLAVKEIITALENTFERVIAFAPENMRPQARELISSSLYTLSQTVIKSVSAYAAEFVKGMPSMLFSGLVTLLAGFYISKDYERLIRFLKNLLKPATLLKVRRIKGILTDSVFKLAAGYFIIMLFTLAELSLGLALIGVKRFMLIAAVIAVVDLLPVLGCGTVLVPWSAFALINGNFSLFVKLLCLYAAVSILRSIEEPRIIGGSVGINPLLMLISIFIGLKLGGLGGMLFVPVFVIVVIKYYKIQLEEEQGTGGFD